MRQAFFKGETPRLKPKSSAKFLAIKRWQWTKIKKVIKHLRSSKLRLAHICAHSRIPVKWWWWCFRCFALPSGISHRQWGDWLLSTFRHCGGSGGSMILSDEEYY
jgi:hypothetical protein